MQGVIIKGIAGFYYVKSGTEVYQCKARGVFKKRNITPTVGDRVEIEFDPENDSMITKVLPRSNCFVRPSVSNVDCFAVVLAAAEPEPNFPVTDKFLVMAEKNKTEIVLCVNKIDTVKEARIREILDVYEGLYPVVTLSASSGQGIESLKKQIAGKKTAFAGPSGVGKSTILNKLSPAALAETGQVSDKTKRGKHTTRHVELFELEEDTLVFDTPGFSSFDILTAGEEELQFFYPEMAAYIGTCKYYNCRHEKEPGCAIKAAVKQGEIHPSRYQSYLTQLQEIRESEKY